MRKEYLTVKKTGYAEYEEKKSRFISTVRPVTSEEEAISVINSVKTKYWDASHNVYAYSVLGSMATRNRTVPTDPVPTVIQRYSDDGEPGGTAGLPVMEAIKRTGVQNVVVVITRFFGGTLLGASGLVRSYSKSATLGLNAAGMVRMVLCIKMKVSLDYTYYGKMQNVLTENQYLLEDIDFMEQVSFSVAVEPENEESFTQLINNVTSGNATIERVDKMYVERDIENQEEDD